MMMGGANSPAVGRSQRPLHDQRRPPGQLPRLGGASWGDLVGAGTWVRAEHHRRRARTRSICRSTSKGRAITGMVVTLTDRITELSGLVVDDKGKPATEHTLVLYPGRSRSTGFFQSRRIRTTRAGEDGRYLVPRRPARRLSAGDARRSGAGVVVRQGVAQRSGLVSRPYLAVRRREAGGARQNPVNERAGEPVN